ncbi:MAG: hypothetical protein JEY91_09540 [Spirochaetaceae bacterium]|nr:hypothetical protein [Spirochaetaceae bacterium]
MLRNVLVYVGGFLNICWGIAHLIPTNNVVSDFGEISRDNKLIIRMEWINEGLTLIFIGLLVIVVTLFTKVKTRSIKMVYLLSFLMLLTMAIVSLFTGFQIDFIPFKLCPVIFLSSGVLIVQKAFGCDKKVEN